MRRSRVDDSAAAVAIIGENGDSGTVGCFITIAHGTCNENACAVCVPQTIANRAVSAFIGKLVLLMMLFLLVSGLGKVGNVHTRQPGGSPAGSISKFLNQLSTWREKRGAGSRRRKRDLPTGLQDDNHPLIGSTAARIVVHIGTPGAAVFQTDHHHHRGHACRFWRKPMRCSQADETCTLEMNY